MAEMDIKHTPAKESDRNKSQVQSGERGAEGRSGGLAKRGFSSPFFALTPRDIFTASPFELMRRFSEDMDRLFEGVGPRWGAMPEESTLWSPPVEVSEQAGQFVICARAAGNTKRGCESGIDAAWADDHRGTQTRPGTTRRRILSVGTQLWRVLSDHPDSRRSQSGAGQSAI